MSPAEITFMFRCYWSPECKAETRLEPEYAKRFITDGLISEVDGFYRATERGIAWVSMILATPYPRQAWLDQSGSEVKL